MLSLLLTAATDEGAIGWGVRVGRSLPLAPVCAMLGAWTALLPTRARGEILALAALGRTPWQNARGAIAGGFAVAAIAAAAIAWAPPVDVAGFFPVAPGGDDYAFVAGAFVDPAAGVRIERSGAPVALASAHAAGTPRAPAIPGHGRAAAGLATALTGLALPMIAASTGRGRRARTAIGVGALAVVTTLLFQAAAAARVSALAAILPTAALLAIAVSRYYPARWKTTEAG